MNDIHQYRNLLLDRYGEQPESLAAALEPLQEQMHEPLAPGEWSAHQVLAHVEAAERQAFHVRIHQILNEDKPSFEYWDEIAWMSEFYDESVDAAKLLDSLRAFRIEDLAILRQLKPSDWSRTGTHALQGVRTLQYWVEYSIVHVDDHIGQLAKGT